MQVSKLLQPGSTVYFTVVELRIYAASDSEHRSRRGVVTLGQLLYFTVVELLIYAASASEHRLRRGVVTLTYVDLSGER